jgi:hypothetical protein
VRLFAGRGGGGLLRAAVPPRDDETIPLLVDSSRPFPLVLQDEAWKKAGIDLHALVPVPEAPTMKHGMVPVFRVGGFDLAKMPALEGVDLSDLTSGVDIDLGGVVGADLLAFFRVTFADGGRFMWIEPDPSLLGPVAGPGAAPPVAGAPGGGAPSAGPAPPPAATVAPSHAPASNPPPSSPAKSHP